MKEVHAAGGTGCSGGICGGGRRRAYFHEELVRCYMRKWWDAKEAKAQLSCVARHDGGQQVRGASGLPNTGLCAVSLY